MTDDTATLSVDGFDSVQIGKVLRRFGGIAFWLQVFIALVPITILTVVFSSVHGVQSPMRSAGLVGLLSLIGFVVLIFTTFWCWRYRKLGRDLAQGAPADPERLTSMVWFGLIMTTLGIVISMVVLMSEMAYLMIRFLEMPQAGVPVIQTVDGSRSWISAIDILSLMTVVLTLAAEIVVLMAGMWILGRIGVLRQRAGM